MRVGVLGGGQLAQLLAQAGERIGVGVSCLDPAPDACAASVAYHVCAPFDDRAALDELAGQCAVVTYEFENVPAASLRYLESKVAVYPGEHALRTASDRVLEKTLFQQVGMATAPFAPVEHEADLAPALASVGLPALLKTRHAGYDGKGQVAIRRAEDLHGAWQQLGRAPAILEAHVHFERELSIIAARGRDGALAFYPLSENLHRDGILRLATSRPAHPLQARAEELARALLLALDYRGVLALELFQVGDTLLANEFAPRVHNSGHWTLQGAITSQFENHLRAILGMPLGATAALGVAATVNFIGGMPLPVDVLAVPQVHLSVYGKTPRPRRKLGHATVQAADAAGCQRLAERLLGLASTAGDG